MNSISGNTERAVPDVNSGQDYQYDTEPSGRGVVLSQIRGLTMSVSPELLLQENQSLLARQVSSSPFLNNPFFLDEVINTSK